MAGTGTITGQSLSGDSLQKHVFIQNATVQASVAGTASQVNGTADSGAVALQMNNGYGTLQAQGSLTLTNPTTLQQLTQAPWTERRPELARQRRGLGPCPAQPAAALAVPLAGVTLPSSAMVAVNWTDITNPSTLTVTVTPAPNLSNITIQPVLQALQGSGIRPERGGVLLEPAAPRPRYQPRQGGQSRLAAECGPQ